VPFVKLPRRLLPVIYMGQVSPSQYVLKAWLLYGIVRWGGGGLKLLSPHPSLHVPAPTPAFYGTFYLLFFLVLVSLGLC